MGKEVGDDMHQRSVRTRLKLGTTTSRAEASVHVVPALTTTPHDSPVYMAKTAV